MLQQKALIIFCVSFALATGFLFWQNERELDPTRHKSFWNLSFAAPNDPQSLVFSVTNFTDDTQFEYTLTEGRTVLEKNSFAVEKTTSKTITPQLVKNTDTTLLITVTHGKEKKEIYRK